jgi:hypothetical protein
MAPMPADCCRCCTYAGRRERFHVLSSLNGFMGQAAVLGVSILRSGGTPGQRHLGQRLSVSRSVGDVALLVGLWCVLPDAAEYWMAGGPGATAGGPQSWVRMRERARRLQRVVAMLLPMAEWLNMLWFLRSGGYACEWANQAMRF